MLAEMCQRELGIAFRGCISFSSEVASLDADLLLRSIAGKEKAALLLLLVLLEKMELIESVEVSMCIFDKVRLQVNASCIKSNQINVKTCR